jgi:hypothetical protein
MDRKSDGQPSLVMHLRTDLNLTAIVYVLEVRTEIYCGALPLVRNDLNTSPFCKPVIDLQIEKAMVGCKLLLLFSS